jgi:hypothetical protein
MLAAVSLSPLLACGSAPALTIHFATAGVLESCSYYHSRNAIRIEVDGVGAKIPYQTPHQIKVSSVSCNE